MKTEEESGDGAGNPDTANQQSIATKTVAGSSQASSGESAESLTILRAQRGLLTKVFNPDGKGGCVEDKSRPKPTTFDAQTHRVADIDELAALLEGLVYDKHSCVLRGQLRDGLRARGARNAARYEDVPRKWVAVDIDGDHLQPPPGLEFPADAKAVAEHVRDVAGVIPAEFAGVTAGVQVTASAGIAPGVRLRLWFILDHACNAQHLKLWFTPWLGEGKPADGCVFRPAQPIFTAEPEFTPDAPDPIGTANRFFVLEGWAGVVTVPDSVFEAPAEPEPKPKPKSDAPADLAKLREALEFIPLTAETDYNAWCRVALALFNETGGSAEGLELLEEWTDAGEPRLEGHWQRDAYAWWNRNVRRHDPSAPHPKPVGAGSIFAMAKPYGFKPGAPPPAKWDTFPVHDDDGVIAHLDEPVGHGGDEADADDPGDAGDTAYTLIQQAADVQAHRQPGGSAIEAESVEHTGFSDDALANAFVAEYGEVIRYDHTRGRFFVWDGIRWNCDETGGVLHSVRRVLSNQAKAFVEAAGAGKIPGMSAEKARTVESTARSAGKRDAVVRLIHADPRVSVTSTVWDRDPWLLGTPDGTVDLRDGTLRPADAGDHITRLTGSRVADRADCPLWLRFLDQTAGGDQNLVAYLRRVCGYLLTGSTREHALFFVYGAGGNGKSVFLETINGILGEYGATAPAETFTARYGDAHPTELARLDGPRLVAASETEAGRAWAESRIKSITGGDRIAARFMNRNFFEFEPQFKLMIAGNHKPALRNVDAAAMRRFRMIGFEHQPENPDRDLKDKLKAEWPGILRWAIDGCLEWQRVGLAEPKAVLDTTSEYFDAQDIFGQWMDERLERDPLGEHHETTEMLFADWRLYAERRRVRVGSYDEFAERLTKAGIVNERRRVNGERKRVRVGVKLCSDFETVPPNRQGDGR